MRDTGLFSISYDVESPEKSIHGACGIDFFIIDKVQNAQLFLMAWLN